MKISSPLKSRLLVLFFAVILSIFVGLFAFWLYFLTHPISYVWVMDRGDLLNETHLVKMCSNGRRLWQTQFGQSGAIGYDPVRDIIWAPELNDMDRIHYDQVVKVDADGNVVDRIQDYRTVVLAVNPNDGNVWMEKQVMIPNQPSEVLIAKLAPNGKLLFTKDGALSSGIWAIALDPRDGTIWIGGHWRLIHLTQEGVTLFETSDASFFSSGPHQIAVNPKNSDIWYTTGVRGDVYRMASDGTILTRVSGFIDPNAIAIHPDDESVWVTNFDQPGTGSVTKVSQDGEILLDVKTPDHAQIVGINPYDDIVWVGYDGGILLLDQNGELLDTLSGFHSPVSFAFGQSGNKLEAIIHCAIP